MVQEVFRLCAVPSGTEADEPLQAREKKDTKENEK